MVSSVSGESTLSTRAPLAIFLTSPLSTVPGPTSTKVVTPSAARRSTDSCQRTVPDTWRTSPERQAAASRTRAASTLLTSGGSGSRNASASSSGARRSWAGCMSAQWKGAETGSGTARLAPLRLALLGRARDRRGVAGDHHLARRVDVGGLPPPRPAPPRGRRPRSRRARGPGSRPSRRRRPARPPACTGRGAGPCSSASSSESAPGGDERRVLPEAVARDPLRPDAAGDERPQRRDDSSPGSRAGCWR